MQDDLIGLLAARTGHFRLESGHHGDVWLDLDALFLRPGRLRRFVAELARRLARHGLDAVCGPLIGGAFVAQMIAVELDLEFNYAERLARTRGDALYPVAYRVPEAVRGAARGKRVAIVDDVMNAGSAVRATLTDLRAVGAESVTIGALLVLGSAAAALAAEAALPLERIASLPGGLWAPSECPLCAAHIPLEDVARA
jgi:orotate phosphoribosyltransferase